MNVLDGVTFDVLEGEHIGLLGKNGAGKTTLFRIICGELYPDEGQVVIAPGKRVGLVAQMPDYPADYTGEDVLKDAHRELYAMRARMEELERRMAQDTSAAVLAEYDRLSTEFIRRDGYEMDRLRNTVANGLGIPDVQRRQLFSQLSGGEKTRMNLARLILEDTDILLLDEPTNHLDMRAAEWLEDYLAHFRGTVVAISHDRYFLDKAVTRCVEITGGKAALYSGNYSFYVAEKERRYQEQLKRYEKEQAEVRRLQQAADKLHLWAFMGNDKLHKRAFSMEKRIEKLSTERPDTERKMKGRFSEKEFQGDEVLSLEGVTKSFGGRTLFSDLELTIRPGERIALIGDNGTGKTTLLQILTGRQTPDRGIVKRGPAVKTACLEQVVHFENPQRSVLDTLIYDENYQPQEARDRLGAFKFSGEDVFRPVSQLSGGEKSRLRLCILMRGDINFLILDEPTNHLDIASREWIEEAVEDYAGTLLFVSHDRYFINRFASRIWELENGTIRDFRGTYEQYRAYKSAAALRQQAEKETVRSAEPRPQKQKRETPRNTERLIAKLEKEIAGLEAQSAELDALAEENATDYEKLMEVDVRRAELAAQLEEKYAQWEELAQ